MVSQVNGIYSHTTSWPGGPHLQLSLAPRGRWTIDATAAADLIFDAFVDGALVATAVPAAQRPILFAKAKVSRAPVLPVAGRDKVIIHVGAEWVEALRCTRAEAKQKVGRRGATTSNAGTAPALAVTA